MFAAPWKMHANDRGHRTLCQKLSAWILKIPKESMQKATSATWTDSISGIFQISTVPFSNIERQLSTTLGHKLTKALINGIQLNFKQQIKDFWLVRTWQDQDRDQTCSNSDLENWAIASSLCSFEHSACAAKVASCSSSVTLRANVSFLLVALLSKAHYKHAMQGVSTHKHKPSIGHSCVCYLYMPDKDFGMYLWLFSQLLHIKILLHRLWHWFFWIQRQWQCHLENWALVEELQMLQLQQQLEIPKSLIVTSLEEMFETHARAIKTIFI